MKSPEFCNESLIWLKCHDFEWQFWSNSMHIYIHKHYHDHMQATRWVQKFNPENWIRLYGNALAGSHGWIRGIRLFVRRDHKPCLVSL